MKVNKTQIDGLFEIECPKIEDDRGEFSRFFCVEELATVLSDRTIVQVNYSKTNQKGSIRGMHYQIAPFMETKLVRCTQGEVFDVAVDLRKESRTFLHWYGTKLNSENNKMLLIPEGFAHGFQSLEANSTMLYLHTATYAPECERGIRFDDPLIDIKWPNLPADISEKDKNQAFMDKNFMGISV